VEERENQGMGERRLYVWGKFFLSNAINAGSFLMPLSGLTAPSNGPHKTWPIVSLRLF
jgi:hypothetical protein